MDNKKILVDLFNAYYDARRNKRNTQSQLKFEINYEKNLFELWEDLCSEKYKVGKSVCFISFYPVKREIFAADFRDRVVHHLIFNYINLIFEKTFINDSYSCRKNKGMHYGIKRIDHFIRSCSQNYKKDCYILKLDIRGYFMSMNKQILFEKIKKTLNKNDNDFDTEWLLRIVWKIIFNDPRKDCLIVGDRKDWNNLPKTKSLFYASPNTGLPIGNLTSQLFGNIYLNELDHFIKRRLKCKYYGRYVDDFVIIHEDKDFLENMIKHIDQFLRENLSLELSWKKVSIVPYQNGILFLGAFIKPYRIYIRNRIKGNFYKRLHDWVKKPTQDEENFISSVNSYFGIMKHFNTYNLRIKIADKYSQSFLGNHIKIDYENFIVSHNPK